MPKIKSIFFAAAATLVLTAAAMADTTAGAAAPTTAPAAAATAAAPAAPAYQGLIGQTNPVAIAFFLLFVIGLWLAGAAVQWMSARRKKAN